MSMVAQVERAVGIFWDFDQSDIKVDTSVFAAQVFEIAKSYSSSRYINDARLYTKSSLDELIEQKLGDIGFEIVREDGGSLSSDVLFWLWDMERSRKFSYLPCVVVLTFSPTAYLWLNKLKNRSIYVVCISKFFEGATPINADLRKSSSSCIDIEDVPSRASASSGNLDNLDFVEPEFEIEDECNRMTSTDVRYSGCGEDSMGKILVRGEEFISSSGTSMPSIGSESRGGGYTTDEHWNVFTSRSSSSDDHIPSSSISFGGGSHSSVRSANEGEVLSAEQRALHDELVTAVYAYNVKEAVTTLRKIYNKQTRCFRIHTVLAVVLPDTAAMTADGRIDLLCVAVSFALDCIQWTLGVQKGENVDSFKYKMNINIARWILRETVRKGVTDPPPAPIASAVIDLVEHILDSVVEPDFAWELLSSLHVPQAMQRLVPYLLRWRSSHDPVVEARLNEFLHEHKEFSSIIPPSQPHYRSPTEPGMMLPPSGTFGSKYSPQSPDDLSLEGRLLKLLARSTKGELGARIPALYRDEFGEPLRLRGRKLKDILLDTGKVEMIGSDGPGDKLFRLVAPRSMVGSAPIPRSSMNGSSSLGPRGVGGGYNPQAQISYSAGAISDRRPVVDASRFLPYGMNSVTGIGGGGAIMKSNSSEERYLASRNGEAYGINGGGAILKSGSSEERYLASRNSEDQHLHFMRQQQQPCRGSGGAGGNWPGIMGAGHSSMQADAHGGLFVSRLGGNGGDHRLNQCRSNIHGGSDSRLPVEDEEDNSFLYQLHDLNFE